MKDIKSFVFMFLIVSIFYFKYIIYIKIVNIFFTKEKKKENLKYFSVLNVH